MDFDRFLALPRPSALALAPDGSRLVAAIGQYDDASGKLISALWELDPTGATEPQRLTRSAGGESQPVFHADGSLYFVSARDDEKSALWRLPAAGEAERVCGADDVRIGGSTVVIATSMLPGSKDAADDEAQRKERKTSGILHTSSPVRVWGSELGPDETRLQVANGIDLTPTPGNALIETEYAAAPDGRTVIAKWFVSRGDWPLVQLVAIDTATGDRRVLAEDPEAGFYSPVVSPDSRYVVATRWDDPQPDTAPWVTLVLIDLETGERRDLVNDPAVWPSDSATPVFTPDSSALYFVADDHGDRPIVRVDLETGVRTRITDAGSYTSIQVAPDGSALFALHHDMDSPHAPVRVDLATGDVVRLMPSEVELPGRVERVEATAPDGATIPGWLLLPNTDGPAPLVLRVHGGPDASAGGWNWRWNPWWLVAAGYAVLLPDPALSIGYGKEFIERGWQGWGATVYDDVIALTDVVEQRPDIDATRTAAIGGSFGGYMVNWIAGHTDRFRCLISHAGIWHLAGFQGTADYSGYFARQFGTPEDRPERYAERSPSQYLKNITTPILVTHGGQDQRVPTSQGNHLFADLQRRGVESAYLSFPDEGHMILKPANARLWNQTMIDWLDRHLR
ncbi:S9 family peptidase [Kribbella albertanoniae]|uniref:S9 family peptidase n=1 Tax=Kribbella albertanoniae TaxID=1266829 RepID=A0A4R4PMG9_9ACTN|nr:S9 family peptidase [Kribbella albertanoniae]TDC23361.1 S9 family peptidase [Kribbella albertanoniae]